MEPEHECLLCLLPRDGAALSSEDHQGTEVWVRNGVLITAMRSAVPGHFGAAERIAVVWEGDENAPSGQPAAVRPCDMHGFVKVVVGRVKSRVQLAPSAALAMEKGGRLYGCSFENPRRIEKGVPLVPEEMQHCDCVFHRACIGEWKAKSKNGSNCPICLRETTFSAMSS